MRDVPRAIHPIKKLLILTRGTFLPIGLIFLISAGVYFQFWDHNSVRWWIRLLAGILGVWGLLLIGYSLRRNLGNLRLLTWGRIVFGKLLRKQKSHTDSMGNVAFEMTFEFDLHARNHTINRTILEAYHMEQGEEYILLVEESHLLEAVALDEFSPKFRAYFQDTFSFGIDQAKRNQHL